MEGLCGLEMLIIKFLLSRTIVHCAIARLKELNYHCMITIPPTLTLNATSTMLVFSVVAVNMASVLCWEVINVYMHCSSAYLVLVVPLILAGVILVLFIKTFDFTVCQGTINGLILYANII